MKVRCGSRYFSWRSMKKIIFFVVFVLLFLGFMVVYKYTINPSDSVNLYLKKYRSGNVELNKLLTENVEFTEEEKSEYIEFMREHYDSMEYKVSKAKISGNDAIVPVHITVKNYASEINSANAYYSAHAALFAENYTFVQFRLDKMKEVKKYTEYDIDFDLKYKSGKWEVQSLSTTDRQKLAGLYGVLDSLSSADKNKDTITDNVESSQSNSERKVTDGSADFYKKNNTYISRT